MISLQLLFIIDFYLIYLLIDLFVQAMWELYQEIQSSLIVIINVCTKRWM